MSDSVDKRVAAHVFSSGIPERVAANSGFRRVFEAILEGLERADHEGLGSPHDDEAESLAEFAWRTAYSAYAADHSNGADDA